MSGRRGGRTPLVVRDAAAEAAVALPVTDENGERFETPIAGEYPLTLYVDKREIITLMTLGRQPAALAVGWLLNQRLIRDVDELAEVWVDWEAEAVSVRTRRGEFSAAMDSRLAVTSGCGQGTMFASLMEETEEARLDRGAGLAAAALRDLLAQIRERDTIYKRAGAVHGCALAAPEGERARILMFVEDIGRHNAVDAITGWMRMSGMDGGGKVFYTTGRLTSEMVIKCAQMGVPYLASRSGTTRMGHQIANKVGLTMIGRALNRRYLIYSGARHFGQQAASAKS